MHGCWIEARVRWRRGKGEKCNLQGALLIECAFLPLMSRRGEWRLSTGELKGGRGVAGPDSTYKIRLDLWLKNSLNSVTLSMN